jgi:Icc-related predicted phosphoesterase
LLHKKIKPAAVKKLHSGFNTITILKFTAISDTHGKHQQLSLPPGDVLIHAGDISGRGNEVEVIDFLNWFTTQNFEHKILIAGNHDFYFEREPADQIKKILPKNIIYLNDSGATINNIKIWGSPITPWFYNWAFNRHRGNEIKKHWDLIPGDTEILITHGPVYGILDNTNSGHSAGCEDLLNRVNAIKPKLHICGHIHEAYGVIKKSGATFINASVLNERYELVNEPIIFEL